MRINYNFTALQPIHTGADKNLGILKQFRRGKVIYKQDIQHFSKFTAAQHPFKRRAVALLLLRMWYSIEDKARVTIYDEVTPKLVASTAASNKEEFFTLLCEKLDIRSVTPQKFGLDCVDIINMFETEELFELIRNEYQWIMMLFRKLKDDFWDVVKENKGKKSAAGAVTLFGDGTKELATNPVEALEEELIQIINQPKLPVDGSNINYVMVPEISGNSIRGLLRRIVMHDFCEITGVKKMYAPQYHRLFTGGTITESTGYEDIGKREEFVHMCPAIGLFGSAIGNQTIQGDLIVGMSKLCCKENENGDSTFHNFLEVKFGTRLDSEKLEDVIEILNNDKKETHQMFYEWEVLVPGTRMQHSFGINTDKEMIMACFGRMLKLFYENNYICAKSSIGNGEIDLEELKAKAIEAGVWDLGDTYVDYLKENSEQIREYFSQY